jgi:hypothetical protein
MRKVSIVLGSLIGAFAIHAVVVACGSSTAGSIPTANAGQGTGCNTWQISVHYTSGVAATEHFGQGDLPAGLAPPITLPGGWEPLSAMLWPSSPPDGGFGYGELVTVRHCAD